MARTMNTRIPFPGSLAQSPVIAVLRATDASAYEPVVDALLSGGVKHIELTLSTPGTIDALAGLLARYDGAAQIGIGTVTTVQQAQQAIAAGASYLVTPTSNAQVTETAIAAGLPIFPGGFTPTELHASWQLGASAVKVFPASHLGPRYVADLRGPFPDIEIIPSGGVTAESAIEWLRAGACAVSLGGPLLKDAFQGGDLNELSKRSQLLLQQISDAGLLESAAQ